MITITSGYGRPYQAILSKAFEIGSKIYDGITRNIRVFDLYKVNEFI